MLTNNIKRSWNKVNPLARRTIMNCLLGVIVVLVVHQAQSLKFIASQVAQGYDLMLSIQSGSDLEEVPPFVYLDIDSDSHLIWGEPLVTPRDKLAKLLEFSLSSEAKAIILDIDLNLKIDNTPIASVLESYSQKKNTPPLILMKTFSEVGSSDSYAIRKLRASSLDNIVSNTPHYHWASPLFEIDNDLIVRRWKQWVPGCSNSQPALIPSSQLLLLEIDKDPTAQDFYQATSQLTPPNCNDWESKADEMLGLVVDAGDHQIHWQGDELQRLIMYNLPWPKITPENTVGPTTTLTQGSHTYQYNALTILPAHLITETDILPDNGLLKNHFVIIGNSSNYGGDLHGTPLGLMPGSLIVINAVHSLFSVGEVNPPPLIVIILIELVLLVCISLLFAVASPGKAVLISTGFVILIIFPVACIVFKEGVWLDFTLPLIAVELYELVTVAEEKFRQRVLKRDV